MIGATNDGAEREAEAAAGQAAPLSSSASTVAPKAKSRLTSHTAANNFSAAPSIVDDVLSSPGQPLDATARAALAPHFERGLYDVRIHTDARAAESARAIDARAYAAGRHVVFGPGQYAPDTLAGRHLLAHELAHVAQHQAGPVTAEPVLRRRPVTTDLPSVAQYEWTGTQQQKTSNRLQQAYVSLSYDPATGYLNCLFYLRWRFPAGWNATRKSAYADDFVRVVRAAWQDKFPLVKWENGKATSTTARVLLDFDNVYAPDLTGNDTEYINWLMNDKDQHRNQRWTMNVHPSFLYRDKVDAPNVHLEPGSNTPQTEDTSDFKNKTYTSGPGGTIVPPPYQHYFNKGINPSQGSAPGGKYTQTASVHEFGHMIGLADEYVMPADDYNALVSAKGQTAADAELRKRTTASARVENMGDQVTKDAYGPFADFLHTLTAEDWRVQ